MRLILFMFVILVFSSACKKDDPIVLLENNLAEYIEQNKTLEMDDLIACAGGKSDGLFGPTDTPTSVFFYPISGATDFRYYESEDIANPKDFSKYVEMELSDDPIFNGYLRKFNRPFFEGQRVGIVSFTTPGKLHLCNPIQLKSNTKPTEANNDLLSVDQNGVNPTFNWQDGLIDENAIYFQVISDDSNNLISGTYTFDLNFTFYNLDNVVLNITDSTFTPALEPNQNYKFTLMAVSEDNWVNLFIEKEFMTN